MLVNKSWFASLVCLPFYTMAFIGAVHFEISALGYLIYGVSVMYACGVFYHNAVTRRVNNGLSEMAASSQWFAAQMGIFCLWYVLAVLL